MEWKLVMQIADVTAYTCDDGLIEDRYLLKGIRLCNGKTAWTMKDNITGVVVSVRCMETAVEDFLVAVKWNINNYRTAERNLKKLLKKEKENVLQTIS